MHIRKLPRTPGLFALVFLAAAACLGQVAGRISGTVIDATGASVPGARVTISIEGTVIAETVTKAEGLYAFSGLRPENYDVKIEANGFTPEILKALKVDAARETSVAPIQLNLGNVASTVEVSAAATALQTTNAELSTTITKSQLALLPQLNRNPMALISTQAGVGSNGRESTTINGLRTSFTNVTVDGVNVQDNYIRTNALDFIPNRLLIDGISEMTISTSNTSASMGGAAAQISFVTPSGTNIYHGALYEYNRNSAFASNNWFNNRDKIALPRLNQNQFGGYASGRIVKDKLFFFTNYEMTKLRAQTTVNRTILTDDARNGIFTYADSGNIVRKVNLFQLTGKSADPSTKALISQLPPTSVINNYRLGDSLDAANLRNTAGYTFLARNNTDRKNFLAKIDYIINSKLSASGNFQWNHDYVDRPGTDISSATYAAIPVISNDNKVWLGSYTLRWTPAPTFTNEARGGYNLAPGIFASTQKNPDYLVGGLLFSNPVQTFLPQGRFTDTYNLADNASWVKGKHKMDFGFQSQLTRVYTYNDAGIVPTYNLGIGGGQTANGLSQTSFPGIRSSDFTIANSLLANLAGYLNTASATFNVKDRTSGYIPNQTNGRNIQLDNYALYFQDSYKASRKLSLTAGLRWEYFTPVNERDSLELTPVITNNNVIQTLLSNATLDFGGNSVGRPYYNKDLNNFAPNLGMAYTPFSDGKTVLRAGYSLNFVNDNLIRAVLNAVGTAGGLSQGSTLTGLSGTLSARPAIAIPTFKVPRTQLDNYSLDPNAAMAAVDPNLRTSYVQQWNFSIQREIKGGVLEVRYVGNKGTKLLRGIDYNQVNINAGGFLTDFRKAYANGLASMNAGGSFNPNYNAAIPGSQQLAVFPSIGQGGQLTNPTVVGYIQTQQVGELANYYQTNALTGPRSANPAGIGFYQNPYGLGMNLTTNFSNSTYNALQMDYSRRYARGFLWQINYTYSKSMSDTLGNGQTNFEALLDYNNAKVEKARTPFDLTHSLKSNGVYELPFGKGKKFVGTASPVFSRLVGGWSISGIFTLNTGNPFSILSNRGTLNRSARSSSTNTASTTLNKEQLDGLMGLYFDGGGPYFIAKSAIGQDGRGVASDGTAPFQGQAFTNPGAGTIGGLQRRMFSGPTWYNLDFGIQKRTQINERHSLELRLESTNVTNHPTFYYGDEDINSTGFGKVASTQTAARRIQLGLYYRF